MALNEATHWIVWYCMAEGGRECVDLEAIGSCCIHSGKMSVHTQTMVRRYLMVCSQMYTVNTIIFKKAHQTYLKENVESFKYGRGEGEQPL